jgi:hypothetical protein
MEQIQNTKKRERGGASILCLQCKCPTRVLKTRRNDDDTVHRVRLCLSCHNVFDTIEKHLSTASRPCSVSTWRAVVGIKN